jgi:hypothetical protein
MGDDGEVKIVYLCGDCLPNMTGGGALGDIDETGFASSWVGRLLKLCPLGAIVSDR